MSDSKVRKRAHDLGLEVSKTAAGWRILEERAEGLSETEALAWLENWDGQDNDFRPHKVSGRMVVYLPPGPRVALHIICDGDGSARVIKLGLPPEEMAPWVVEMQEALGKLLEKHPEAKAEVEEELGRQGDVAYLGRLLQENEEAQESEGQRMGEEKEMNT